MSLEPPERGGRGEEGRRTSATARGPCPSAGKRPDPSASKAGGGVPKLELGRRGFPPIGGGSPHRFQGGRRREKRSSLPSSDWGFLVESRRASFSPPVSGYPSPNLVVCGGKGLLRKEGLDPGDRMGEKVGFLVAVYGGFFFPSGGEKSTFVGVEAPTTNLGGTLRLG